MTITDIAALLGMIFGVSALVLGILNYSRDKGRITVTLQWDMSTYGDPRYDEDRLYGVVTITNIGRRPVYISHVALKLPKKYNDDSYLVLRDGIAGQKLAEGDPPAMFPIDQDGLEKYAKGWKKIRAQVSMSTGRKHLSKKVKEIPSWAKLPPDT